MSIFNSTSCDINDEIYSCLNLKNPESFFLFAGAGSGKTRTLVETLQRFRQEYLQTLKLNGQKIAIITYTNAASDEINRRLEFDPNFVVSTIHSFVWNLICHFQVDIKGWVRNELNREISELEEKKGREREGTKKAQNRDKKIELNKKRLENLYRINHFTYNPEGVNSGRGSLNHSQVIDMASDFLSNEALMQDILVKKYPILLIDESQDTNKKLIEAFFKIEANFQNQFTLGLFGDTMQRIYMDGKVDLGTSIPNTWKKPAKLINYRCPKRVIQLINKIRLEVDGQEQVCFSGSNEGLVRLFIVEQNEDLAKSITERNIAKYMSLATSDLSWDELANVKILTLEHRMAAKRDGFIDFFEPLYTSDTAGLLNGTMTGIPFLRQRLLPLIQAKQAGDEFSVAQIMRKYSPLLSKELLRKCNDSLEQLRKADSAVTNLWALWSGDLEPSLAVVLRKVEELEIFELPEHLSIASTRTENITSNDTAILAWQSALQCPFKQLEQYANYVSGNSPFGTHQGVKGLEFPRVMVILDDEDARGFLFSYEKLLGAKPSTETDVKNELDGKDTGISRTRRLFYVACSRAEKSLAIVAYTENPSAVKQFVTSHNWFMDDEILTNAQWEV